MAIDWNLPLCTKRDTPHIGRALDPDPVSGRRRVAIFSPSQLGQVTNDEGKVTVFRYDEDGKTRGDGAPSDNDLVNYDPDDGAVRIDLNGRKVVCSKAAAA